jgi:ligand-binding sensor domain-containing protein/signal transduction histidine kinase
MICRGSHRLALHMLAIVGLGLLIACPAVASTQIRIHQTIGVEDGLMQSQVACILEDRNGFVWFGTFGGLCRWDGINFTYLRRQDGLISQDMRVLYEAPDGSIFIGSRDGGFSVYRDGTLTSYGIADGLSHQAGRAVCALPDGRILLGTGNGVDVFRDGRIDTTGIDPSLHGIQVTDLETGPDGTIYCASEGHGVIIVGPDATVFLNTDSGLPQDMVPALHLASDGTLYISVSRHGIWTYRRDTLTPLTDDPRLRADHVISMLEGHDGTLYFGTEDSGVRLYRDGIVDTIDEAAGLTNPRVSAIEEDRNGLIYFGTWSGVCLYRGDRIVALDLDPDLRSEIVTAIAQGRDGSLYFATVGANLFRYADDRVSQLDLGTPPVSSIIWSIHESRDERLYIGLDSKGVMERREGSFAPITGPDQQPLYTVFCAYENAAGELYWGTYDGLFVLADQRARLVYTADQVLHQVVYDIEEAPDGTVYLATQKGVLTLHDEIAEPLAVPPLLADAHIWTIHAREDGALCFGTNNRGMVLMRDGQTLVLDATSGLTDNTVLGILEDDAGRLYLSTNRGVNIVDLSAGEPVFRYLHQSDGLPSEECVQGAYYRDNSGNLWFGTIGGVCRYDPVADHPPTEPPRVHLTRVRIFEDEVPLTAFAKPPRLEHNENYLKFEYVGIHPAAPEEVLYRYRLSGVDRDWVETDQRLVQYTNLSDGDYHFELMAGNEWGMWSQPTSLAFTILPPFWRTWWFILLVVVSVAGGVSVFVLYRLRQVRAIDRIRRRISSTLHDDVGSGLSSISILSSVIEQKTLTTDGLEIRAGLQQIGEISRDLIASTSDLVWMANPKQDSLFDLISRLGAVYADLLQSTGIAFEARNLEALKNVRLSLEYRQELFLLFKEAINNALKHSRATTVRLEAERCGQELRMRLSDDGKGFDLDASGHGSGLTNMRDRARALGGRLEVHGGAGGGTIVEFRGRIR